MDKWILFNSATNAIYMDKWILFNSATMQYIWTNEFCWILPQCNIHIWTNEFCLILTQMQYICTALIYQKNTLTCHKNPRWNTEIYELITPGVYSLESWWHNSKTKENCTGWKLGDREAFEHDDNIQHWRDDWRYK